MNTFPQCVKANFYIALQGVLRDRIQLRERYRFQAYTVDKSKSAMFSVCQLCRPDTCGV